MPRRNSLAGRLRRNDIDSLIELHGLLQGDQIENRDQFHDLMQAAYGEGRLRLDYKQLADAFHYSPSTVHRWVDGRTAPHPSLWPAVVQHTSEALKIQIQILETTVEEDNLEVINQC